MAMAYTKPANAELLAAALAGYQHQYEVLGERMAEIRRELGSRGGSPGVTATTSQPRRRRGMSAETRARMAEAQRRRWAGAKKSAGGRKTGKKRNMSAEGKSRIGKATRKRWEEYRAQKGANQ